MVGVGVGGGSVAAGEAAAAVADGHGASLVGAEQSLSAAEVEDDRVGTQEDSGGRAVCRFVFRRLEVCGVHQRIAPTRSRGVTASISTSNSLRSA